VIVPSIFGVVLAKYND